MLVQLQNFDIFDIKKWLLEKWYRVDRQCLFFGNPPGIHRESTFWKVAKIIGKSSTSEKPFEGGFPVDSHPFSTRSKYCLCNFLKVDSQPFSNMDLATFQDFELDLELHRYGQGCLFPIIVW